MIEEVRSSTVQAAKLWMRLNAYISAGYTPVRGIAYLHCATTIVNRGMEAQYRAMSPGAYIAHEKKHDFRGRPWFKDGEGEVVFSR
jgi:uncharacterized oligopeptide transporter (OPT) family protein